MNLIGETPVKINAESGLTYSFEKSLKIIRMIIQGIKFTTEVSALQTQLDGANFTVFDEMKFCHT